MGLYSRPQPDGLSMPHSPSKYLDFTPREDRTTTYSHKLAPSKSTES
jgi:hypothetical protein